MNYVIFENDSSVLVSRPEWFNNLGQPVSDEELFDKGYYLVVYEIPEYDSSLYTLIENPIEDWLIDGYRIFATYTISPIDLDTLKRRKKDQINEDVLKAIDAGFLHDGYRYDSDQRSMTNIIGTATGAAAGVPLPEEFTWRTQDNTNVPMDATGIISLGAGLLQHVNTQYAISWHLKSLIENATFAEELNTINWPT